MSQSPNSDSERQSPEATILFDGVCNLCSAYVQYVIRRDPGKRFRFAQLQSAVGQALLTAHGIEGLKSMILIRNGKAYRKSSAAIRIGGLLRFPWPVVWIFWLVPKPVRDWCYDFVGSRRYRWFGKKTQCWVPDEDLAGRFLD